MTGAEGSTQLQVKVETATHDDTAFVWAIYRGDDVVAVDRSDRTYRTAEKAREVGELELTRLTTEGD